MITATCAQPADVVVERLKAAVGALSMALITHIDGQANAARKGLRAGPDQILEVFRPDFAVRVWAADKRAGLDIPIRYHVYEQDGVTHMSYRAPSAIFAPYANPELDALARELDVIFAEIFARGQAA
ncbi:MAG: DUF302 domain-containing protein [Gammaproteobacteria bacterium]|nr:DUF302 domain-containing protein [Gammaproteobacteria bacterium]